MCCAMIVNCYMSLYYVIDCIYFVYKLILYGLLFHACYKLAGCQLSPNVCYMMDAELYY